MASPAMTAKIAKTAFEFMVEVLGLFDLDSTMVVKSE